MNTPAGLVIGIGGKVVYHLGDTGLFSDLAARAGSATRSTSRSCASAATTRWTATTRSRAAELVGAKQVIPCHYNTFPPIETDAQAFKSDVESQTSSEVVVLEPGETHSI